MNDVRLLSILGTLLLALMAASMVVGSSTVPVDAVLSFLQGEAEPAVRVVLLDIRLPRVLLAAVVGGALSMAGAALQGLLRNPLADPGIIGITASASLGAVLSLYLGLATAFSLALPLCAIAMALFATLCMTLIAGRDASVLTLVLAGVAISSFASALTSLVINLSPNPFALGEIVLWLLGSLTNRSVSDLLLAAPFVIAGGGLLLLTGRQLDALTLGEETAVTLGVNLKRLRYLVVFGAALAVGASVAVAGSVSFVGLIVPHVLRPFVGHAPSRLLLPSALGGAILIVFADLVVRLTPTIQELKLGVITALLGAPFFLHLLWTTRKAMR